MGWLVSARVSESLSKWVTVNLEPRYLLVLIGGNCDELCLPENKCRNAWLVDIDALVSDKCWRVSLIENLHKKSDFLNRGKIYLNDMNAGLIFVHRVKNHVSLSIIFVICQF